MLESTANFIGKDGFNWWVGQVENTGAGTEEFPEDKDETNKVKVRILGYHNPSRIELTSYDLPWATVMMPNTSSQRSGIGTIHQLQVNGWVVGFFMDGASAQVPIVIGTIGDENPDAPYKTENTDDEPFPKLVAGDYNPKVHGEGTGAGPHSSGSNVCINPKTGLQEKCKEEGTNEGGTDNGGGESTSFTVNNRGRGKKIAIIADYIDKDKCKSVNLAEGKCGGEPSTKIENVINEFMEFARKSEKNDDGNFIDKFTGDVMDVSFEIKTATLRINKKLHGLTKNIKGVVMEKIDETISDKLDKIATPDPEKDKDIKKEKKGLAKIIECLFDTLLDDIKDFIENLLKDLFERALDSALCLIQDILGQIMNKLMDLIDKALSAIEGVVSKIKGAMDMIEGLVQNIADLLDLFCDGELTCASKASTYETCHGPRKRGRDEANDKTNQYEVQPPNAFTPITGDVKNDQVAGTYLGQQMLFNTKTGKMSPLAGNKSGFTEDDFDTRGPIEKFEDFNFLGSDGSIPSMSLNCSNSIFNKKPCFPEIVWDNLQSTTPVKALPIVDNIGSILGAWTKKKGSGVPLTAQARAQFTCNEPEGGGAEFKPNIKDGKIESIAVVKPGIGYGFDPAETFCPNEQYNYVIPKGGLSDEVNDGELLYLVAYADGTEDTTNPDVMQVVDVEYSESQILIATVDKSFEPNVKIGMKLKTKSNYEFVLNFSEKFPDLVVPPEAKAIYANCGDLIPVAKEIQPINVGKDYKEPVITIGVGKDEKEIGKADVDEKGQIINPQLTEKVLGFAAPKVKDKGATGGGAVVVLIYDYAGPIKVKEILAQLPTSQTYIDCVGHPMIKQ
tara:strand:+ start:4827 stop:7355 length:2529 start_codon:yes stop_codon:yes gene_type:complete